MIENQLTAAVKKTGSTSNKIFPNFLYIGASKAGSSWIYQVLREHPEVFVPDAKDIQFFDVYYNKGINWYLSFFRKSHGKTAIGEIAHDYFLSEQTAKRIHEWLPNVKLFCCLREPVEKTMSAYLYKKAIHMDKNTTFEDYISDPTNLKWNYYYSNLLPFYQIFPQDQILVLFYDELKQDPTNFIKKIYSFIGVNPDFMPPSLHTNILPARKPRSYLFAHFAYKVGQILRQIGLANLVGQIKLHPFFELFLYKKIEQKPEFPIEMKKKLQEHFWKDYSDLSALIGRDLPASWFK